MTKNEVVTGNLDIVHRLYHENHYFVVVGLGWSNVTESYAAVV